MHFRKIKRRLTEVNINEPLKTDSEGNTLTIADILSNSLNIEEESGQDTGRAGADIPDDLIPD